MDSIYTTFFRRDGRGLRRLQGCAGRGRHSFEARWLRPPSLAVRGRAGCGQPSAPIPAPRFLRARRLRPPSLLWLDGCGLSLYYIYSIYCMSKPYAYINVRSPLRKSTSPVYILYNIKPDSKQSRLVRRCSTACRRTTKKRKRKKGGKERKEGSRSGGQKQEGVGGSPRV